MPDTDQRQQWLDRVATVRRHVRRDGDRSPHKPLLLLYALGQLAAGTRSIQWSDAERPLRALLDSYGPPNPTDPNHPFRRLAGDDDLWTITSADGDIPDLNASGAQLRDDGAVGQLSDNLVAAIDNDPGLPVLIARFLLEENWPPSLHDDIAAAVGLDIGRAEVSLVRGRLAHARTRRRDPGFRTRVLTAYEYRCAVCGYDGWLDRSAVGLEAAHIRWWSSDGPDTVDNGLCVCSLHHVLFDSGVLGISADHLVTVSKRFVGRATAAQHLVLDLAGAELHEPQTGDSPPAADHVAWHTDQVFRGPARAA